MTANLQDGPLTTPLTALFLGGPSMVPAAVIARWLADGNRIAAFWKAASQERGWRRERVIRRVAPQWSSLRCLAAARVPLETVPRLTGWADGARRARDSGADVLICCYFPYLIPPEILDLFPGRAFNFHPALLPRYRGPTPQGAMIIDRALDASGMTLHRLDRTFDTGDIVAQLALPYPEEGPLDAYRLATAYAAASLVQGIPDCLAGRIVPRKQDETQASYGRARKADFVISPAMSLDEVRWRCRIMPPFEPPAIAPLPGRQAIGLDRVLGAPTGEKPRVGWLTADFDIADARIRVRLRRGGWRRLQRWRFYATLRRAPVIDPDHPIGQKI